MTTGVLLAGHGSRSAAAAAEFSSLAAALAPRLPEGWILEHGFLEFADPVLGAALDRLADRGATRVLAVPGILLAAAHAKNDIPSVLAAWSARRGIEVRLGRELGIDPMLLEAGAARIRASVAAADAEDGPVPLEETCLVVIGRGASDPDANGNVAKIARMIAEGMGFGWVETGYSGVTFPLVEPCLEHAARLGYRRIVVFPWFLFSGVLIDRIFGFTRAVAARHPGLRFVEAGYLGAHPRVLDTFIARAVELTGETPPPNCLLCKYRTQVLGFERDLGAPQESHHHHVEGQGAQAPGSNVAACTLCADFCTGLCRLAPHAHAEGHGHHHAHDHAHDHHHDHPHDHAHAHAPHPHAQHPHGPESVRRFRG